MTIKDRFLFGFVLLGLSISTNRAFALPCELVVNQCSSDFDSQPFLLICDQAYAQIRSWINPSYSDSVELSFLKNLGVTADTLGNKIAASCEYLEKNPDDLGLMVHEVAHVLQNYPEGSNFWLTEGIADYIREKYTGAQVHCVGDETYASGYRCAATFLKFIEKEYDSFFVKNINETLQRGEDPMPLFQKLTGKTLEKLWHECRYSTCFYKSAL